MLLSISKVDQILVFFSRFLCIIWSAAPSIKGSLNLYLTAVFSLFCLPLIFIVAMHVHHFVSNTICQRMIQPGSHLCWLLCFGTEVEMRQTELVLLCLSDLSVNRFICLVISTFNLCWLVCIETLADMAKTELALLHPTVN